MNKKTLWIILGITSNTIFLIGLLLIILSFKYDTQKEYAYTETTSINIQKDDRITANERPLDDSQEHDNRVNNDNKDYATNNTSDYVIKTTTKKSTYNNNSKNNSNDNKNYSNTNNSNNKNDTNNSNDNNTNNSNNNNNYTVEYTNTSYCGFCGKQLNNNDGICQDCREIRSKLGE
jgi:hypothetical protein|nr:MAG TPA: zinc-ribbon domain protein [Caudoviricetes sp.]